MENLLALPTPVNISIWWNGGSILGMLLGLQIITGIFLSMHYTADMVTTFDSVIHIMRDVPAGWLFRSLHANGASMFFAFIYIHIGRGLYYQSFITQPHTWSVGVTIFLISMATAFLGYVLPWGQMSFWGATVITNLLSAIPYIGSALVEWVWGGFSVNQATLNRFYSLHFLLPFVIGLFSAMHIFFLHDKGSTNPLGMMNHINKIPFHPYYTVKDIVGGLIVMMVLFMLVMFSPNLLIDPENFIPANPMSTPPHIQPEWYFLFAYAILRSIPSKLGGVIALVMSIFILYFFPLMSYFKGVYSPYNFMYQMFFWMFIIVYFLLTWLGACPIEEPFLQLSKPLTFVYFLLPFLMMLSFKIWANNIKIFL
uniref:Cytochrome b n=1 Tax=Microceramus pontificus TaxID=513540 RepID=A0A343F260_9EUPU|nr:cytochrome b [Microceramus pontificus]ASP44430.1 cytochrome b [Microceramus pontificus]